MAEWTTAALAALLLASSMSNVAEWAPMLRPEAPAGGAVPGQPHPPIQIRSDLDFLLPTSGRTLGTGTAADPYIIEGWDIDLAADPLPFANARAAIDISGTTAYFIVRNCLLLNGGDRDGVYFERAANGRFENVGSHGNRVGAFIVGSTNIQVVGVDFSQNEVAGLIVEDSAKVRIESFELDLGSEGYGVFVHNSTGVDVERASIRGESSSSSTLMLIATDSPKLRIVASSFSAGIQTVRVHGADGFELLDSAITHNRFGGLEVSFANQSHLKGNRIEGSGAVEISASHGLVIEDNDLVANRGDGLALKDVDGSIIRDNRVERNAMAGIDLAGNNNTVTGNVVRDNGNGTYRTLGDGIRVSGNSNRLENNTLERNGADGISIREGRGNTIRNNGYANNRGSDVTLPGRDSGNLVDEPGARVEFRDGIPGPTLVLAAAALVAALLLRRRGYC